jgi:ferredoxin
MVRGVEQRYVDFDKCIPYFAEAASCGICIAECPLDATGRTTQASRDDGTTSRRGEANGIVEIVAELSSCRIGRSRLEGAP